MGFSLGHNTTIYQEILNKVSEGDIAQYYLGINKIPCLIQSPLRQDNKPSFSLYSPDGKRINFIDFSTNERGSLITLLCKLWKCNKDKALVKIKEEVTEKKINLLPVKPSSVKYIKSDSILQCKTREWKDYDLEYWESFGISLKWLKYANVFPISHKIIIKEGKQYTFPADKYAYAFLENKEKKLSMKIYQPFNKKGYKWCNKHDASVLSLWTRLPEKHPVVCICSSLKDALCLWSNTGIPSIAVQGEGYTISDTAKKEIIKRFTYPCICFDNDKAGLKDGESLSKATGFINIVLPEFKGGKDISDYYKVLNNKELFKQNLLKLFKVKINEKKRDLCRNQETGFAGPN